LSFFDGICAWLVFIPKKTEANTKINLLKFFITINLTVHIVAQTSYHEDYISQGIFQQMAYM